MNNSTETEMNFNKESQKQIYNMVHDHMKLLSGLRIQSRRNVH